MVKHSRKCMVCKQNTRANNGTSELNLFFFLQNNIVVLNESIAYLWILTQEQFFVRLHGRIHLLYHVRLEIGWSRILLDFLAKSEISNVKYCVQADIFYEEC